MFLVLPLNANAQTEPPQFVTVDGRLYDSTNPTDPLLDANVAMRIQVLNPAKTCILYEEQQSVSTLANGYFNARVGSPTAGMDSLKRTGLDSGNAMSLVFQNQNLPIAGQTSGGLGCSYTPAPGESRYFRFIVTPSTTGVTSTLSPDMTIDSVPQSLVAETLQGFGSDDFLQINANVTQAKANSLFGGSYAALTSLLSGTSTLYLQNTAGGTVIPSSPANPATLAPGQMWYDSTTNEMKYYDGTVVQTVGAGLDATKLPLAGGTMAGAINMGSNDITSVGHITQSAQRTFRFGGYTGGQETTLLGTLIPGQEGTTWYNTTTDKLMYFDGTASQELLTSTSANSLVPNCSATQSLQMSAGPIYVWSCVATTDSTKLALAGGAMTGALTMNAQNQVRYADADSSNYAAIQSPAVIGSNYVLTLPVDDGTPGQVLQTDGNGILSWLSIPSAPVTSVFGRTGVVVAATSDYDANQIDNTPAGGISATDVQAALNELDTEKAITTRNIGTAANSGLAGGGNLSADRNLIVDITGTTALGSAADNADEVLIYDASGTVLRKVTRAQLNLSEAEVDAFVANNGFAADADKVNRAGDTMTGALNLDNEQELRLSEADGNGTNYVAFKSPSALAANYTLTFPINDGNNGQYLQTDGNGVLSWVTPAGVGETNTASNVTGSTGVGLFKQKSTFDLEFKSLLPGSTRLSVTGGADDVTLDVVEANINHDALLNFVANEHIDHSAVNIATAANSGLAGGGDITATRNLTVDITGTTALGAAADNADEILIYDTSGTALRKVTRSQLNLSETEVDAMVSNNGFISSEADTLATVTGRGANTSTNIVMNAQAQVRFADSAGGEYAAIQAPATLGANYVLTLPVNDGGAGEVLSTDGNGILSWITIPSAPVTSVFGRTGIVVAATSDYDANQIDNTPAGTIAATDVQAALNELDTEKAITTRNINTAANSGLAGGGDLSADRNLVVDITGTTALGAPADNADEILIYDTSATARRKVTRAELNLSETEVDAMVANNGYAADADKVNRAGDTMTGALNIDNEQELRLSEADGNGANYVAFKSPATLGANYTLTLPADDGTAGQVLSTDGNGVLSWIAAGSSITADSLNFTDLADALVLDASTDISATGTNVLSITNIGTGNSFLVNDEAGDTTPFVINNAGQVGIGGTPVGTNGLTVVGGNAIINGINVGRSSGGTSNTLIGENALGSNSSAGNTAVGRNSLASNTAGQYNTSIGFNTMESNQGSDNVAIGAGAIGGLGSSGGGNVALGNNTLGGITTGNHNTGLGRLAGSNITSGSENIILGYNVLAPSATADLQLNIGNLIYGDMTPATRSVDINGLLTVRPSGTATGQTGQIFMRELAANGTETATIRAPDALGASYALTLPMDDGTSGQVLSTDGNGVLSWIAAGSGITADSLNFTDLADALVLDASTDISATGTNVFSITNSGTGESFRVNDEAGDASPFVIDSAGSVGIGTTVPSRKLSIYSTTAGAAALNISDYSGGASPAPEIQFGISHSNGFVTPDAARIWATALTGATAALNFSAYNGSAPSTPNLTLVGGNVGIGTTDVTAAVFGKVMHMHEASTQASIMRFTNTTSGAGTTDGLLVGVWGDGTATLGTYENQPIDFNTSGAYRMRLTGAGEVGIGTTVPGTLLDVAGAITSRSSGVGTGQTGQIILRELAAAGTESATIRAPDALGASYALTLPADDGTSGQVLSTDGNGVLSWIAPSASIAADSLNFTDLADALVLDASTDISATGTNALSITNSGTGASFRVNDEAGDTTPFIIDNAGNVGVGTTVPDASLHVMKSTAGDVNNAYPLGNWAGKVLNRVDGAGENGLVVANRWFSDSSTAFLVGGLADFGNGFDSFLLVTGNGQVGIGTTTPGTILDVAGAITSRPSGTGAGQTGQIIMRELAANGTSTATIRVPDSLGANYVLTLPVDDGTSGQVLSTDGNGVLSWIAAGGAPAADSLNFTELADALVLDASTDISVTGANVFSITKTGTGDAFVVNTAVHDLRIENNGHLSAGSASFGPVSMENMTAYSLSTNNGWNSDGYVIVDVGVGGANPIMNWIRNSATQMILDSNGQLGVGTATPGTRLDVAGAITSRPFGTGAGQTGQLIMRELAANGTNTATIRVPDSLGANYVLTLPVDDGTNGQVLSTDGNGVLSWVAGGGTPAADSLNFSEFADAMVLDASTDISATGTNVLSITNSGSGDSFRVNDVAGDTSPFIISATGDVAIGTTTPVEKLTVVTNSAANDGVLILQNTNAAAYSETSFLDSSGNWRTTFGYGNASVTATHFQGRAFQWLNTGVDFVMGNTSGGLFTVQNAGNVGIGTTVPGTLLDVAGAITSRPSGTGTGQTGQLIMRELAANGTNTATVRVPDALGANYVLTLPVDDGTSGQVLSTDGNGVLSWIAPGASIAADSLNFTDLADALVLDASTDISVTGTNVLSITNSGTGNSFRVNDETGDATPFVINNAGFVGAGTTTPGYRLDVAGDVNASGDYRLGGLEVIKRMAGPFGGAEANLFVGTGESMGSLNTSNASRNVAVGTEAGRSIVDGSENTFVGYSAGSSNSNAHQNTLIGNFTGYQVTTGGGNTAIGAQTLTGLSTGSSNVVVGGFALGSNTTGHRNIVLGVYAAGGGAGASGEMNDNVVIGHAAGNLMEGGTPGNGSNGNILIGHQAGNTTTTGDRNILLGFNIDAPTATTSNFMSLGNIIFATGVDGEGTSVSAASVGIGTSAPGTLLDVAGAITSRPSGTGTGQTGQLIMRELAANGTNTATVRVPDALGANYVLTLPVDDGTNGQVLTTDGNGVLSWTTASGAPGADSINFTELADTLTLDASTTINVTGFDQLTITNSGSGDSLRVNDVGGDTSPFIIDASGSVAIGTTTPSTTLDVVGAITSRPFGTGAGQAGQIIMRELVASGTNTATIRAPDTLGADYVLTLPVDDGTNGQVLSTNGSGVLSWISAGAPAADSINFTELADALVLDASTDISATGTNVLSVTNSGTGSSFRVNDDAGDTTPFIVTADGYVGVSTASPSGTLTVFEPTYNDNGTIRAESSTAPSIVTSSGSILWGWVLDTGDGNKFKLGHSAINVSSATPRFTVDTSGNVGIGTTNPGTLLEVTGPSTDGMVELLTLHNPFSGNFAGAGIRFEGNGGDKTAGIHSEYDGSTNNANLVFQTRNANSLRDALKILFNGTTLVGGDLGSTEGGMFHVNSPSSAGNAINDSLTLMHYDDNSAGSNGIGNRIKFVAETATNGTYRMTAAIDSVMEDANNNSKDGSLRFSTIGPNAASGVTAPTEKMRIDSSGNVGIGSTIPATKLDVVGTIATSTTVEGSSSYVNSTATYTIPDATLSVRRITLNANTTITLPAFTTPADKVWNLTVIVQQDATGARTLAWAPPGGNTILWDQSATAPVPQSTANSKTIYQFIKVGDETTWYGSMVWKQN